MKRRKMEKGITLIALIITIVVLLILAAVAISSITKDGILQYATNAAKDYNQAVKDEQEMLDNYLGFLSSGEPATTFEEATKTAMLQKIVNSTVYDAYGNKIVVPAGFKIRIDDTTNNADTVTEGIVIEDASGNQFVWIPVGKIYTDTEKTEANAKTITLGRYNFDSTTGEPVVYSGDFTEDTVSNHNSRYGNKIARDIEAFIASTDPTTGNGGYYLGRYEARKKLNGGLTTVSIDPVWNNVNQETASSESQGMYADGYSSGTFSSDLINSYAWDTAIVFLQTFDNRTDKTKPYSIQNSLNRDFETTGTTTDIICNIYDMASNCYEWSTETYSSASNPCVPRGGNYYSTLCMTRSRDLWKVTDVQADVSFRPILYVA